MNSRTESAFMEATETAAQFDFSCAPEIENGTADVIELSKEAVGRMLKSQAGIQGIMAVFIGAEASEEQLSNFTRGNLFYALEALSEHTYLELTKAVKKFTPRTH